jgi:hypothetical protein
MAEHKGTEDNKAKSNITWRVVDDEALMLDLTSGYYFSLNPTATEIWEALQRGTEIPQIIQTISFKYKIDEKVVESDLHELITDLRSCRLWD